MDSQVDVLKALASLEKTQSLYEEINDVITERYNALLDQYGTDKSKWSHEEMINIAICIFAGMGLEDKRADLRALIEAGKHAVDVLYPEQDESKIN